MLDLASVRPATSVELLVELGAEHGVTRARLLAGTGLHPAELTDVRAEVTAGQELAVAAALVAELGDPPGLGLLAGERYHLTSYGIWGFALVSSPTLRSAIDVGSRYLALTYALTDIRVVLDGSLRVTLGDEHLPEGVRRFLVDRDAAALRSLQRELFPETGTLERVRLRAPAPETADQRRRYVEVFGTEVAFDAPVNEVVLPAVGIDAPRPKADARTAALAEAQCEQLLEERTQRVGVAGEVRQRLLRDPADPPTMAEVARERHVTERTLRRQLAAAGTSYRQLVDEVRDALAHELLVVAGLSVEQTARRLGFVEPASFVHAFRRWRGTTPGAYRDEARRARGARGGGGR